ncbi:acyltransferase family protein [Povalibacter sp.]|uniref:acyltransferase family protein n=1 Tax=Povalibacter sp. TaxID=1962978 RepID=UPI002F427544
MPASYRVASLDILRGLTVIGMIVVNAAAGLQRFPIPASLLHSHWIGLTFADLVFPAFIFMVGVSVALSMPTGALDRATMQRMAVRSLRLILLGLFLTNIYWLADPEANTFRWGGVLQRIGIVFLVIAPSQLVLSTRALVTVAVALLVGYSALCHLPVPDGTPVDLHVAGANFIAWVDRVVLGTHIYVRGPLGYDPEGLLSTLPAIAQGCLGIIAGRQISASGTPLRFAIGGVLLLVAGGFAALVIPVSKDLWSASFVLVTSGITLAVLGALHEFIDVRRWRLPLTPLAAAFGVNAIAAYVLHYVTAGVLNWKIMDVLYTAAAGIIGSQTAFILPIIVFVGSIGWAMRALQRRGWIIKL